MLHYLLGLMSYDALLGNIAVGNSWEGFVVSQIAATLKSDDEMYYYRTQDGAEIDLLVRRSNRWLAAVEIKFSSAPSLSKGTYIAMEDLDIEKLCVITPEADTYPFAKNVEVTNLRTFLNGIT